MGRNTLNNRILFLDIDGPMIPSRAYFMKNQTYPVVTKFDPCAVSLINSVCSSHNLKIVLHSSWILTNFWKNLTVDEKDVHDHCVEEGIKRKHFHQDMYCNREIRNRYLRVEDWLKNHPEVEDFVILDDEPIFDNEFNKFKDNLIQIDFDEGFLMKNYNEIVLKFQ